MKKNLLLYFSAFFLVFISCEKEALEPEIQEVQLQTEKVSQDQKTQTPLSFKAHLSGDEEVPAVETNATGQTIFKLNKDGTELYYKLLVANIENITMAHIHVAPPGENGPALVWLYPIDGPPASLIEGRTSGILAEGIITVEDLEDIDLQDLIELMAAGETYVNVHTSQNPGGEIRGQIAMNNSK